MEYIVLEGVKPYDGRWPLEMSADFTTREWGVIKRLSGYLPLTIEEGFQGGDPELFAAFAVVALVRAGRVEASDAQDAFDRIADAPFGAAIRLDTDTPAEELVEGGDAGPPAVSKTENAPTNGDGSTTNSETSEPHRNVSGIHASAISGSDRQMWET